MPTKYLQSSSRCDLRVGIYLKNNLTSHVYILSQFSRINAQWCSDKFVNHYQAIGEINLRIDKMLETALFIIYLLLFVWKCLSIYQWIKKVNAGAWIFSDVLRWGLLLIPNYFFTSKYKTLHNLILLSWLLD